MKIKISASKKFLKIDQVTANKSTADAIRAELGLDKQVLLKELKQIADDIAMSIRKNISSGRKFTGGRVARLAKSTIKRKRSSVPLIETGRLLSGIIIKRKGDDYVVTLKDTIYPRSGTSLDKVATYLNYGTPRMPARPFFGISNSDAKKIILNTLKKRFSPK